MLRLVESGKIARLPVGNLREIADAARAFADLVDDGLSVETAFLVTVIDGELQFTVLGDSPTIAEGLGLLDLAKAKIVAGSWQ